MIRQGESKSENEKKDKKCSMRRAIGWSCGCFPFVTGPEVCTRKVCHRCVLAHDNMKIQRSLTKSKSDATRDRAGSTRERRFQLAAAEVKPVREHFSMYFPRSEYLLVYNAVRYAG